MSHNYRLSGWIWVHLNKPFTLIHTLDYMNNQSDILAVRRHWLETYNDVIFSAFMLLRWISIETTQKWLLLLCLSDVGFRRAIKKGPIVYSTSLKYNKFVVNLCEIVFCLLKKNDLYIQDRKWHLYACRGRICVLDVCICLMPWNKGTAIKPNYMAWTAAKVHNHIKLML